ncbi:MAG TPA: adenosylcobinamide-GDP ribazoletransferase [Campylobacterales bacterium]|nr:adenosylcobinamide-GDP ribazoletransferase [Campylobacterales bacterium]HHD80629.1 adenosylcobinamide-GDP ribazoletransferase [Campylobacterales bacterium]HHH51853.1 adenosylcobinamide-GDP ribazoletransferase [Campylobacterales bacterium]
MREFYLGIKFSLSYFSAIPISFKSSDNLSTPKVLGVMLFFLPFVGLILGAITVTLAIFLSHLGWYGSIISAIVYMMLYGFIHTEAIIDVADAIYAKRCGKDAYKIIKESTVGAMGVLYAMGYSLMKISGILYLLNHHLYLEFISVLIISRLSLVVLIDSLDFKSSFVTQLKESLGWQYLIGTFILSLLIGSILTPFFIILMVFGFAFALGIAIYLGKRLGFINGDVLGATLEGVEILLFLVLGFLG